MEPVNRVEHVFKITTFTKPTYCSACGGFIWGLKAQGVMCDRCGHPVHHKCAHGLPAADCGIGGSLKAGGVKKEKEPRKERDARAPVKPFSLIAGGGSGYKLVERADGQQKFDNSNNRHDSSVSDEAPPPKNGRSSVEMVAERTASSDAIVAPKGRRRGHAIPGPQECNGHAYELVTFTKPTYCGVCSQFIWGLAKQGLRCCLCGMSVHRKCAADTKLVCRPEDQLNMGALTLDDWRTENCSLELSADGESSKEVEHLVLDDTVIETLRERNYDPTETVVAMYQLYDMGQDYRDADVVEAQIKRKWSASQQSSAPPPAPPSASAPEESSEGEGSGSSCVVCMDGKVDSLILPCKHLCLCGDCGALVKECPVCRGPIAQLVTGIFYTGT